MSGRAGATHRPLYARALGLRHLDPGGFLCFVLLEGTVTLGSLLALAELVPWWGVLALPVSVAVMVKINDMIAAAVGRAPAAGTRASLRGHGTAHRMWAGGQRRDGAVAGDHVTDDDGPVRGSGVWSGGAVDGRIRTWGGTSTSHDRTWGARTRTGSGWTPNGAAGGRAPGGAAGAGHGRAPASDAGTGRGWAETDRSTGAPPRWAATDRSTTGADSPMARGPADSSMASGTGTRGRTGLGGANRTPGQPGAQPGPPADESTTLGLAHSLNVLQVGDTVDSPLQRARQSAARRYE